MAKKFNFVSHEKVKTASGRVGYKVTPWARLKNGDEPPVVIQAGAYYSDSGKPMDEEKLPVWVKDHIRNMNPETRDSLGLPRRVAAKPHESVAK